MHFYSSRKPFVARFTTIRIYSFRSFLAATYWPGSKFNLLLFKARVSQVWAYSVESADSSRNLNLDGKSRHKPWSPGKRYSYRDDDTDSRSERHSQKNERTIYSNVMQMTSRAT